MNDFRTRDSLLSKYDLFPNLYVLIGLPKSGKSVWANEAHDRLRATICSSDDVRRSLGIDRWDLKKEPEVRKILRIMVKALLLRGQDVIVDSTNLTVFARRQWIDMKSIAKVVLVSIPRPDMATLKERCDNSGFPWKVIERMMRQYQPITTQERILVRAIPA
jgi:predicted kinase